MILIGVIYTGFLCSVLLTSIEGPINFTCSKYNFTYLLILFGPTWTLQARSTTLNKQIYCYVEQVMYRYIPMLKLKIPDELCDLKGRFQCFLYHPVTLKVWSPWAYMRHQNKLLYIQHWISDKLKYKTLRPNVRQTYWTKLKKKMLIHIILFRELFLYPSWNCTVISL